MKVHVGWLLIAGVVTVVLIWLGSKPDPSALNPKLSADPLSNTHVAYQPAGRPMHASGPA